MTPTTGRQVAKQPALAILRKERHLNVVAAEKMKRFGES
jgi:hypothetical protein